MDPIFFLSYATNEALKTEQAKFFNDLVDMLKAERDTLTRDRIGFFAPEGIQAGDVWTDALAEALRTSRVFLYMPSDAYFGRPWCSKEWGVFRERIDQWMHEPSGPVKRPPLMIPVLWTRRAPPAPTALDADIQYPREAFTSAYAQEGLLSLMRLKKYRDKYFEFQRALARRILQVYDHHPMQPGEQAYQFDAAPDAFGVATATSHAGAGSTLDPSSKGPRFVVFIYVVGKRHELAALIQEMACYGEDGWLDWKPFQPKHDQRISWFAEGAVHDDGHLDYQQLDLGPGLIAELRKAEAANKIIIFVVDTWSLHVGTYSGPISAFDQQQFRNCSVVIPWSADSETQARADALKGLLRQTLSRQPASRFRFGITSPEIFQKEFEAVIRQARKEALNEVFQEAIADNGTIGFAAKPMIQGNRAR